ncbi:MAG: MASE1 domain-containing protein [Gemmatimonadaceae bacterium]
MQVFRFIWIATLHGGIALALQATFHNYNSHAPLWPPSGISLGLLLIWGRQYWPAVLVGAFVGYAVGSAWSLTTAALLAGVAASAVWLGAWAIERVGRVRLTLPSVRDMALLAVGGLAVAPLWSAAWSPLVLLRTTETAGTSWSQFLSWWFTDALGALAFTPVIVAWYGVRERVQRPLRERLAFAASTISILAFLLFAHVGYNGTFAVLALSVVPLVLWSARRFGMRITTALNAAIALTTAVGFASGDGLFALSSSGVAWAPQLFTAWTVMISLIFVSSVRERDLVVEQLRASEARLTTVLNSSQDQIALLAVDAGRVRALEMGNRALFAALQDVTPTLQADDLIGRSGAEIADKLAHSLQALTPLRRPIMEAIASGSTTQGTHELDTSFGGRVLEATTVPVCDRNGVVTHVLWQSRDVTARVEAERSLRASEARWRSLIEASPQFIMLLDHNRRLLFINRVTEGYKATDVLGTLMDDYMVDDHNRAIARAHIAAVFDHGETRSYEINAYGANRTAAWYRCNVGPVWDQGRVAAAMLLASDITDQKIAEVSKRHLEQQLYQSQKMESLGTLAGGIAHDFNNVLAGIMANAELLRDTVAHDQEAADSIRDILAAGRRARDVVRQILAFSRRQPLERRGVKLSDVILEAMTLLRASLPTTIRLRTTVRAGQVRVFADETQLHQVVMNLATNAAQAIGGIDGEIAFDAIAVEVGPNGVWSGGGTTAGRPDLPAGSYARLVVKDNGSGMDRATLERIFDPFFTTKPMGQGTGLGLAVVHGIVTSHNGTIVAESEPGVGTTITIYLPLYRDEDTAIPIRPETRAGAIA